MGTLFSHLLVTLLSGFYLSITVPALRYLSYRNSGYWNVLHALLYGLGASIIGAVALPLFRSLSSFLSSTSYLSGLGGGLRSVWQFLLSEIRNIASNQPSEISEAAVMGLVLSLAIGTLLAALGRMKRVKAWSQRRSLKATGNSLELLFDRAISNASMVLITLKSMKVYIGFVEATLDPSVPRKNVKILPYLSGYRDKDTHEVRFTTDYGPFLKILQRFSMLSRSRKSHQTSKVVIAIPGKERIEIDYDRLCAWSDNYGVVIPWDEIETASIWDPTLHQYFFDAPSTLTEDVA